MIFVSVLIILVCIAISYFVLSYHRQWFSKTVNTLPGPKTLPFLGNTHHLLRKSPHEILNIFTKWAEDYPSPFRVWMGNKLFIFINERDQIKTVLQNNHCLNKSEMYKFLEPVLGENILTAPVSKWSQQRKMMLPIISKNMLLKFFDIFVEQSLILTDKLENVGPNKNIVFFEYISKCILDTACVTLMDVKLKPSLINQFLETMKRLKIVTIYRMENVLLYSDFMFNLIPIGKKWKKDLKFIHVFIDKIIQQTNTLNKFNTKNKSEKNRTFLDILMRSSHKKEFMQDDFMKMLHNNTLFMLLAASETTATTLNFAIFILANFSEIQERVYKELRKIYGTTSPKSTPIKYEDLQHMNYLENVIKETMRLFPAIPLIARKLTEDLNIGDIILPKDANVALQIMTAQRNEKYWPNPLVFDPDRFLSEKSSNLSYMPFSLGSRNCIGIKYGMILIKVFLATLVRTFKFKVDKNIQIDEIELHFNIVLSTAKPLEIRIEKRELH